jgi:DNA-binding NtrC family response regulator
MQATELGRCRFLLVEQISLAVEEELRALSVLGERPVCRTAAWSERLTVRAGDLSSPDLVVPVAAREPEQAARLFAWLARQCAGIPTLVVLPPDSPPETLSAASDAVDDFVLWPIRRPELSQRLARLLGRRRELEAVRARLNEELAVSSLVGADPGFRRTIEVLPRVAASDGAVLITGETGTGKELVARAIHHLSRRRSFPFVPIDCAGFPEQLLENELFGHARGAFTDARTEQKGLAALAEGGTLFLDEIDALSPASQAKLLRFLEDHVYRPLGAERFSRADVRVLAATNQDLERQVGEGRFRRDLFFRLGVFQLRLPPLRDRREDVPLLAQHFVEALSAGGARTTKVLSSSALRRLAAHDWPGNVRELRNEMQRALAMTDGPLILAADLRLPAAAVEGAANEEGTPSFRQARSLALTRFEHDYLVKILERHDGNITRAAREAGKDRRALGRLVKKHGLGRARP